MVGLGDTRRAGYRLQYAEVLNWGTFDSQVWRFTPGTETALLTGDIGSGKSTIVDALTTLLMPSHKAAYNKAAGAEAKERTLRSYVEGHYKSERNEATGRSRAKGLRENRRTYSVVLGVFVNHGYDETVTLAQVFQQRESTGQPYRFFVTATKALSIATDFADFGTDLRDLRKTAARCRGGDLRRVPQVRNLVASPARNPIGAGARAVPPDRLDEVGRQPQRLRARPHARTERLDRAGPRHHRPLRRPDQGARRRQASARAARSARARRADRGKVRRRARGARVVGARAIRRPAVHRRASLRSARRRDRRRWRPRVWACGRSRTPQKPRSRS